MQLNSFHFTFHELSASGHCQMRQMFLLLWDRRVARTFLPLVSQFSKKKARDGGEEEIGNRHGDDGRVLVPSPGDQSVVLECNSDSDAF